MKPNARACRTGLSTAFLLVLLATNATGAPPADSSRVAPKRDGVRTLYLVRHGIYDDTDPRDELVGKGLIPLGREQSERVGERLRALPDPIDSLFTSPLTRARETAEIVARALAPLTPRIVPGIAECTPATWREDVMATLRPGEADSCRDRLDATFREFTRPSPERDVREVLICHGNVIRYFVCKTLGVDPMAWLGMTIANGSLTVIQVRPDGKLRLLSFSDVGHLPPELQTYTGRMASPAVTPTRK